MEIPNLHVTYHIAGKFGGELDFQTAAPILLVYVDTLRVLMLKVVKSVAIQTFGTAYNLLW